MKPFRLSVVLGAGETVVNLIESLRLNEARFHCDLCGQPLPGGERATSLSYDYRGRTTSFQACPTCLTAKTLLPDLFGKWEEPTLAGR